jgi:hypothetical protein
VGSENKFIMHKTFPRALIILSSFRDSLTSIWYCYFCCSCEQFNHIVEMRTLFCDQLSMIIHFSHSLIHSFMLLLLLLFCWCCNDALKGYDELLVNCWLFKWIKRKLRAIKITSKIKRIFVNYYFFISCENQLQMS